MRRSTAAESEKFLLLPAEADHQVSLCKDFPEGDVLVDVQNSVAHNLPAFFPLQFLGRQVRPTHARGA
eukprot:1836552-Prymnesium_polylepis.1